MAGAAFRSVVLCEGKDDRQVIECLLTDVNQWMALNADTQVAAWIFPGRGKAGMIETLCLDVARQSNPAPFECLDQYADCLDQKHQAKLHEKARFEIWTIAAQTFPAPRKRLSMERVLERLPLDWKNEMFQETREILAALTHDAPKTLC